MHRVTASSRLSPNAARRPQPSHFHRGKRAVTAARGARPGSRPAHSVLTEVAAPPQLTRVPLRLRPSRRSGPHHASRREPNGPPDSNTAGLQGGPRRGLQGGLRAAARAAPGRGPAVPVPPYGAPQRLTAAVGLRGCRTGPWPGRWIGTCPRRREGRREGGRERRDEEDSDGGGE